MSALYPELRKNQWQEMVEAIEIGDQTLSVQESLLSDLAFRP